MTDRVKLTVIVDVDPGRIAPEFTQSVADILRDEVQSNLESVPGVIAVVGILAEVL